MHKSLLWHFYLRFSVLCYVPWCSVSLTMDNNDKGKSAKAGPSGKKEVIQSYWESPNTLTETIWFMLDLPPMTNVNQAESGTGHSMLQCCRKAAQPTLSNHESKDKRMQTGMDDTEESLYCRHASYQRQSKPRNSKCIQTDSGTSMRYWKTWEGTVSRQKRFRDQTSHSRKQQTAGYNNA